MNANDLAIINFLEIVYLISDLELQIKCWIKPNGPFLVDSSELMCMFLESARSFLDDSTKYRFTTQEIDSLKKLVKAIDDYSESYEPYIVVDPEWHKIQSLAKEVMKAFNFDTHKKEQILHRLLELICVMADFEGQKKAWIENKLSDFIGAEWLLSNFNSLIKEKDVLGNSKEYGLSQEQCKELQTLYNHIMILNSQIDEYRGHFEKPFVISSREIYNLPEWQVIQKLSKEVLKAFKYVSK